MNRSRRTKILCQCSKELRDGLCASVKANHDIVEIEAPSRGLVMVKMREVARNGLFYMGELLVTESCVQVDGIVGFGIIAGDREEDALALAVIDAAFNGQLHETISWDRLLLVEEARLDSERAESDRRVLETRVDFQTMDQEAI